MYLNTNPLLKISSSGRQEIEVTNIVPQLCPTLCDPMDCSLPGSSVHGIFQAIVLEWIAISFSSGTSQPRDGTQVSCIVDRCFTIWATREVQQIYIHLITTGIQMKILARCKVAFWKMKLHMICFLLMLIKRPFLYLSIISKTKETLWEVWMSNYIF